jgi:hypothetical protein
MLQMLITAAVVMGVPFLCSAELADGDSRKGEALPERPESGRHLFILSGQSNMTGNLEKGFKAGVTQAYGEDRVAFVRSMKSGRGIRFWVEGYKLPGGHEFSGKLINGNGSEYPVLLKAIKEAGDAGRFETVTFIWMQGESDANRRLGVAYEESFKSLLNRLKSDLGLERMRFVIGRISDHGLHGDKADGWKEMRAAQVRIADSDKDGAWIDTDDLNGGDQSNLGGQLHYPPDKAVLLGERFADKAIELIGRRD